MSIFFLNVKELDRLRIALVRFPRCFLSYGKHYKMTCRLIAWLAVKDKKVFLTRSKVILINYTKHLKIILL